MEKESLLASEKDTVNQYGSLSPHDTDEETTRKSVRHDKEHAAPRVTQSYERELSDLAKTLSQRTETNIQGEPIKKQKFSMALITMAGLLTAAAKKIYDPLMTQYTYQVYTEQIYGNDSHNVQVARQPCVNTSNATDLRVQEVQDRSADFLSNLALISGGISLVANLFLGAYSDTLGRKVVLLLPMTGTFLRYVAVPIIIHWNLGLVYMFAGCILDGVCGSYPGVLLGLYLYTTDVTRADGQRTLGLAITESAIGMGQIALNVVGGFFIEDAGYFYPSVVASSLVLLCIFVVACLLPETVSRDRKRYLSPLAALRHFAGTFRTPENRSRQAMLLLGLLSFLLCTVPNVALATTMNLHFMDHPFCWDAIHIGTYMTLFDGSTLVFSLVTIHFLQKIFSTPILASMGALSEAGELIMLGLVNTNLLVYLVPVVGLMRKLLYPAMRSFLSRLVPTDQKGALFAGIAVVESVCYCLGPFAFLNIYKATMSFMKGFVFLTIAGNHVAVAVIYFINTYLLKNYVIKSIRPVSIQADDSQENEER